MKEATQSTLRGREMQRWMSLKSSTTAFATRNSKLFFLWIYKFMHILWYSGDAVPLISCLILCSTLAFIVALFLDFCFFRGKRKEVVQVGF